MKIIDMYDSEEDFVSIKKSEEQIFKIFKIIVCFFALIYILTITYLCITQLPISHITCNKQTNEFVITQNFVKTYSHKLFSNNKILVIPNEHMDGRGWYHYWIEVNNEEVSSLQKKIYYYDNNKIAYINLKQKLEKYMNNDAQTTFSYTNIPLFWIGFVFVFTTLYFINRKRIFLVLLYPFIMMCINQIISIFY